MFFIYLFGAEVAHYLWYYIFTPGNILTATLALFSPYIVRFHLLPYIYHPYRYGGIPFVAPSTAEFSVMYYVLIMAIISGFYLVSGYMATLKICNKSDSKIVIYNYPKLFAMMIACILLLLLFPLVKLPFLQTLMVLPYANEVVNGIFWFIFTFLGVAWANRETVYKVCGK